MTGYLAEESIHKMQLLVNGITLRTITFSQGFKTPKPHVVPLQALDRHLVDGTTPSLTGVLNPILNAKAKIVQKSEPFLPIALSF